MGMSYRQQKQQKEHDRNELGDRAADGLASENHKPWGQPSAAETIKRRAGQETGVMSSIPGRTRW